MISAFRVPLIRLKNKTDMITLVDCDRIHSQIPIMHNLGIHKSKYTSPSPKQWQNQKRPTIMNLITQPTILDSTSTGWIQVKVDQMDHHDAAHTYSK